MYFSKTKIGLREIGNEFAGRAAHSPSFAPTHPPRQIRGEEPDRLTNQDWPKNQCKPVRPRAHLGETQSADQHSEPKTNTRQTQSFSSSAHTTTTREFRSKFAKGGLREFQNEFTKRYGAHACLDRVRWPSQLRKSDVPGAIQTNSSGRRRGQINIPTLDPRAAIVNANCDASTVTDANVRAKWQSAMSRRHC